MLDIDEIIKLSRSKNQLIQTINSMSGIEVHQHNHLRWLLTSNDTILSIYDWQQKHKIITANQQAMLYSLALSSFFKNKHKRILNLGVGGGCFERFFYHYYPNISLDSIEIDDKLIAFNQQYGLLDSQWPIQLTTAEHYLQAHMQQKHQAYQVILCDIFAGSDHPGCLFEANFYRDLQQSLTSDGCLGINLLPQNQQELINILIPLRQHFSHVVLADIDSSRNVVVLAHNNDGLNLDSAQNKSELEAMGIILNACQFTELPAFN